MRLLYTPTEAAVALGISRSKMYELLRTERIKSVHIDASRRIPSAELERFVEASAGPTASTSSDDPDRRASA